MQGLFCCSVLYGKLEFLLFYDTFNIAVINISLCNRIEKWIFSNCIICIDNKIIPIACLVAIRQINSNFETISHISQRWL